MLEQIETPYMLTTGVAGDSVVGYFIFNICDFYSILSSSVFLERKRFLYFENRSKGLWRGVGEPHFSESKPEVSLSVGHTRCGINVHYRREAGG